MPSADLFPCHQCGKPTHIDLLDAKPTYPGCPDWERFECWECYGDGYETNVAALNETLKARGSPMSKFLDGYIKCALWSSTDDEGNPLDTLDHELAPTTLAKMTADCLDFQQHNATDLEATGASDEQHGHDFWLTRNGHGAGFWDRGYGEVGDRLSKASKVYGGVDLYVGDDGRIYAG